MFKVFQRDKRSVADIRDAYTLTVKFTRSIGDDLTIARDQFPNKSDHDALVAQFVAELQEAGYDTGSVAGSFEVLTIDGRKVRPD